MAPLLTAEQREIVIHPPGQHARVLAVAGSGKTSTMANRARYLTEHQGVDPKSIQVLMFNRLARDEFVDRLGRVGLAAELHPKVNTFHSLAYGLVSRLQQQGLLVPVTRIEDDQVTILANRAIEDACRTIGIDPRGAPVDAEEATRAIGLWKGSLIRPEHAGYYGHEIMPVVYEHFERLRVQQQKMTYDDFVPLAVDFLSTERGLGLMEKWGPQFLIVDEYQDVNYGQQRLVELLAGDRADVMVVGDDDQTIYEWRGARPSYIIREFPEVFSNKPHVIYKLSHTFRFGPVLAQGACNVITFNTTRADKALTAFDHDAASDVHLQLDRGNAPADVDRALCDDVQALLGSGVPPSQIVVLGRMFSQFNGLETQFMGREIPYHVLGAKPFLERREVRGFLNYVRIAANLYVPLSEPLVRQLADIVNFPNRMIRKHAVEAAAQQALAYGGTVASLLATMADDPAWGLSYSQQQRLVEFRRLLESANEQLRTVPNLGAGDLLAWLNDRGRFAAHFDDFYGKGEGSADRKSAVRNLISYAHVSKLSPLEFVALADRFDPTRGVPEEQQIRMTTIFRSKGLEYEYVILPSCEEGYMPCLYGADVRIYDTSGTVREPEASEALENERRLFYVGITRARKAVVIGASDRPQLGSVEHPVLASRFLEEMQLASIQDTLLPLQGVRSGAAGSRQQLIDGVGRWAGVSWVKRSLTESYVAKIGDVDLTGSVAALVSHAPERPFAYAVSYPARSAPRSPKPTQWNAALPHWLTEGDNEVPF